MNAIDNTLALFPELPAVTPAVPMDHYREQAQALSDPELLAQVASIKPAQARKALGNGWESALTDDTAAVYVHAACELARRIMAEELHRTPLRSTIAACDYVRANLRHRTSEVFACIFLDNRSRVIAHEELFFGTINAARVHPREVIKRSLHHNASAVIFAHNHPGGSAEPSQDDINTTKTLMEILGEIDVRVLDHLVVGNSYVTSMQERGLLPEKQPRGKQP